VGFNLNQDVSHKLMQDIENWSPPYLGVIIPFYEFPEFIHVLLGLIPILEQKNKLGIELIYYRKD